MSARLPFQKKAGFRPQFSRNGRLGFGEDDDEHDEQDQVSMVSGFEDNQLQELDKKEEEKPLVITPIIGESWRLRRRRELFVPTGAATQTTAAEQRPEVLDQRAQTFGLQIMDRQSTTPSADIQEQQPTPAAAEPQDQTEGVATTEERTKTLEEQAAEALMREATNAGDEDAAQSMVIPATRDETEAFREDVKTRPDEATMDDYARVPVEQFGAALLRGLGWKEGEGIGRNRKNTPLPKPFAPVKQREALLGLGAEPEDVNSKDKKKSSNRRSAYVYKETSLFKKVAKRNLEEREGGSSDTSESSSSRHSSRSRRRSRSPGRSRHRSRSRDRNSSSSSRHSSRHTSRDRDSSRDSHRRRRRSRSRDSHRSSSRR